MRWQFLPSAIANVGQFVHFDEPLVTPYSPDDLREILETLGKASLKDRRVEGAAEEELCRTLQSLAIEYRLYRELEERPRFKNYREIPADFDALPHAIRDRVIPKAMSRPLKSVFEQARQKASAILESRPKRGALRKAARYDFVNELADVDEQITGRKAAKVGKESGAKANRKPIGLFYNFVLTALKPIDPDGCAGIRDVIDAVIDARGKKQELDLPLKFSG